MANAMTGRSQGKCKQLTLQQEYAELRGNLSNHIDLALNRLQSKGVDVDDKQYENQNLLEYALYLKDRNIPIENTQLFQCRTAATKRLVEQVATAIASISPAENRLKKVASKLTKVRRARLKDFIQKNTERLGDKSRYLSEHRSFALKNIEAWYEGEEKEREIEKLFLESIAVDFTQENVNIVSSCDWIERSLNDIGDIKHDLVKRFDSRIGPNKGINQVLNSVSKVIEALCDPSLENTQAVNKIRRCVLVLYRLVEIERWLSAVEKNPNLNPRDFDYFKMIIGQVKQQIINNTYKFSAFDIYQLDEWCKQAAKGIPYDPKFEEANLLSKYPFQVDTLLGYLKSFAAKQQAPKSEATELYFEPGMGKSFSLRAEIEQTLQAAEAKKLPVADDKQVQEQEYKAEAPEPIAEANHLKTFLASRVIIFDKAPALRENAFLLQQMKKIIESDGAQENLSGDRIHQSAQLLKSLTEAMPTINETGLFSFLKTIKRAIHDLMKSFLSNFGRNVVYSSIKITDNAREGLSKTLYSTFRSKAALFTTTPSCALETKSVDDSLQFIPTLTAGG